MTFRMMMLIAAAGLTSWFAGCDDQPTDRPAGPAPTPTTQPDGPSAAQADEASPDQGSVSAPAEGPDASAELVALELELPAPAFMGTPKQVPPGTTVVIRQGPRAPVLVPPEAENVAAGKPVAASEEMPLIGELDQITDGEKDAGDGYFVDLGRGLQWVQIDLGRAYEIHAVAIWHLHSDARVYRDVIVQTAEDPDFISGVRTIFNNDQDLTAGLGMGTDREYFETNEGLLIDAEGATGRYVRLYTQGSTADDRNHYTEVEVWATEVE